MSSTFCQTKSASFPKLVSTPPIPKKKDTIIYKVIYSSGDTMLFDMSRNLADEKAIHPYKAKWFVNETNSRLLFVKSDRAVAIVAGSFGETICDTTPVFNVSDLSKPWHLSIRKTYYVDVKEVTLRTSIDAIENEKLRHWLKKVAEHVSSDK